MTFKKLLIAVAAAVLFVTVCACGKGSETQEEKLEGADVTWQEFLTDMGMGWCLGNTFDAYDCDSYVKTDVGYETAWLSDKVKTSQEMMTFIKETGFRTVRIPVSWHNHVDITTDEEGKKVYTIREAWLNRVQEVVDYCINEDLYVILNIHHDDKTTKFIYPTEECKENSIAYISQIWTQLAERFADYDMNLIFETMNEVRLAGTADEWNPNAENSKKAQEYINEYNQVAVDTIRSVDKGYNKARFIMCPGYAASLYAYDKYVLPTDNGGYPSRIIVSIHAYTPYDFCMDRGSAGKSVYDAAVQAAIKEVFYTIEEKWTKNDVPAIIGEWGTIARKDNAEARIKYANQYVTRAVTSCQDSAGNTVPVPCMLWDNGFMGNLSQNETYGSLNRAKCEWYDAAYINQIIDAAKGEKK